MSEFFDRVARVQRRLVSGLAGKPEFQVNIDITTAPVMEETVPAEVAPLFEEYREPAPDQVVRATLKRFSVPRQISNWAKLVRDIAGETATDVRNLWVRIDAHPGYKCMTYSTGLIETIVALRDVTPVSGRMRLFVRFIDFAKGIENGMSEVAVEGTKLNYVSGGTVMSMESFEQLAPDAFVPVPPPLSGFQMVKNLGMALREAAFFTKKRADHMGRHKILVLPKHDSTGTVEIVGCGGSPNEDIGGTALIYRREVQAPGLKQCLYLAPLRSLASAPEIMPDSMGYQVAGDDFVWLTAEHNIIVGMENESMPAPSSADLDEALRARNGRADFAPEELDAMRRGLSEIRMNPDTVMAREMVLRPQGSTLEFGPQSKILSVPCTGDAGPPEITLDPGLVAQALTVHGIHAIEFDKSDAEKPVVFAGPGVRVALATFSLHK